MNSNWKYLLLLMKINSFIHYQFHEILKKSIYLSHFFTYSDSVRSTWGGRHRFFIFIWVRRRYFNFFLQRRFFLIMAISSFSNRFKKNRRIMYVIWPNMTTDTLDISCFHCFVLMNQLLFSYFKVILKEMNLFNLQCMSTRYIIELEMFFFMLQRFDIGSWALFWYIFTQYLHSNLCWQFSFLSCFEFVCLLRVSNRCLHFNFFPDDWICTVVRCRLIPLFDFSFILINRVVLTAINSFVGGCFFFSMLNFLLNFLLNLKIRVCSFMSSLAFWCIFVKVSQICLDFF